MKRILLLVVLVTLSIVTFPQQPVEWPYITRQNKPWTRWWWMGSAVNASDLTTSMEMYQKAGLGGMEITAIYGVRGEEDRFINYLSPQWMEVFKHTLNEAGRLDLGIDLANASGWPFGGPWVAKENACKYVEFKSYQLKSGEKLHEAIECIQQPVLRLAGPYKPKWDELKDPISLTPDLQYKALDQVRFETKIPLVTLMAYSSSGKTEDLTKKVNGSGKLNWTASGDKDSWTLIALFQGWHGKLVERAGPGGEGDVIDHFSKKATTDYLHFFDKAFSQTDLKNLRGFFNDSYEVDDARGEANWTPDFLKEFEKRRGYDLRNYLPALMGKMCPDTCNRIICDYRETISDLLLENYTQTWHEWAAAKGKIIRNQAHGSPANILDLYAATDIPEIEGTELARIKFASSAAHVTGKKLTSSESATWLGQHFQTNLAQAKKAVDILMLGGVNHIFYHGTCFSPQDAPWPGWLFYATDHFTPVNPLWDDFSTLNSYVARCQSFMQQGDPDNPILLYFPVYDIWSVPGKTLLQHFDGFRHLPENLPVKDLAEKMIQKGYAFDYISDRQIANLESSDRTITSFGCQYKTIVIPKTNYIPAQTLQKLIVLAFDGATIIFESEFPKNLSGFGDYQQKEDQYKFITEEINLRKLSGNGLRSMVYGEGIIAVATDMNDMMKIAQIDRESMVDKGIQYIKRKIGNSHCYLMVNHSGKSISDTIRLAERFQYGALFNPMTAEKGTIKVFDQTKSGSSVILRMKPEESLILLTSEQSFEEDPYPFYKAIGQPMEIKGKWKVDFIKGGPAIPVSYDIEMPDLWTIAKEGDYLNFSGSAKYTLQFNKPQLLTSMIELDLGEVHESASVLLNGEKLGTLIGPVFKLVFEAKKLKDINVLEIVVTNTMGNRIAWMDREHMEWRKFYNTNIQTRVVDDRGADGSFSAIKWKPLPSGLKGPVTLREIK